MSGDKKRTVSSVRARKRGRPRDEFSLINVLERLTNQSPCPETLRNTANKYLKENGRSPNGLFPRPPGHIGDWQTADKLKQPDAINLLDNALQLDELFQGETSLVMGILTQTASPGDVKSAAQRATTSIKQRADIYNYWLLQLPQILPLLTPGEFDFKKESLRKSLRQGTAPMEPGVPHAYALRALQTLEAIERGVNSTRPTAKALADEAESYLALGDLSSAVRKAKQATEADPNHSKAWILRLAAVTKLRNQAEAMMLRHHWEAQEADPCSPHEQTCNQDADEAGALVLSHDEDLNRLLPQVLLRWPTEASGRARHPNWRTSAIELFVTQIFRRFTPPQDLQRLWISADKHNERLTELDEHQQQALALLLNEHTHHPFSFWIGAQGSEFVLELKMLHLKWLSSDPDFKRHLADWLQSAGSCSSSIFEAEILRHPALSSVFSFHQTQAGASETAHEFLLNLQRKGAAEATRQQCHYQLENLARQFHRAFSLQNYNDGWRICDTAMDILRSPDVLASPIEHPFNKATRIPAGQFLYWQYLQALCAVLVRFHGQPLSTAMQAVLESAETWLTAFQQTGNCFWQIQEFYEGGGGEDYVQPPYDIDLTYLDNWGTPKRQPDRPFTDFDVHVPDPS